MSHSLNTNARAGRAGLVLNVLAVALGLSVCPDTRARGQEVDPWVGARVMARTSEARLRVGDRVLATLSAGSTFPVKRVRADWLWVDAGNLQGWVKKADVVAADQAIDYFSEVIRQLPGDAYAYLSRGIARQSTKDYDAAVADFTEAIRLNPGRDWSYHDRAVALHAKGEFDRALADADEAVRLNPSEAAHYANRASIHFARRQFDPAVADYTEALRLVKQGEASLDDSGGVGDPGQTRGRLSAVKWTCARAECYDAMRTPAKAVADYLEAVRIDPKDAATANSLAWLLATCDDPSFRDGRRAFDLAALACVLTGYRDHLCLDTLAAAYAEAGDFAAAVSWQARAVDLVTDDPRLAEGYRARMRLFQDKTPYHAHEH